MVNIKYLLPTAVILLLGAFIVCLPNLRTCCLENEEQKSRRIGRADVLIMALITAMYAAVAFYRLGNTHAPETFVNMENRTEVITLNIEGGTAEHLMFYTGIGIGSYTMQYTYDEETWYDLGTFEQDHAGVLKWMEVPINYYVTGGKIYITGSGGVWLGEVVAVTDEGKTIPAASSCPELLDEQYFCPDKQSFMNSTYFDEIYHARTAWEHLNGVYPYEITHPPLGKIIIGIGISLFGMTPFGWRFSGTLFGVLMLPIIYIFVKKMFGGKAVPAACTAVMATDFMHFVQTRIATIDTYSVFFILLMYLFMYLFIADGRKRDLALSGIFFGFGAASKWTCFYAGAGLAVIWAIWIAREYIGKRLDFRGFAKNCGFCVIFFVLIPALIYYLAYIPYGIAVGNRPFSIDYTHQVLSNQTYMFDYHSELVAEHPYSSKWYQWLLDIRPILYYLEYFDDGTHSSFGAYVNPVLCWGGLMALFPLGYLAIFRRDRASIFILISYLAQLLPWVLVTRLTFAYHYFPCTVFLILALGRLFSVMQLNLKRWAIPVGGFAALSTACFVFFYPTLSGAPTLGKYFSWLPTWPF